MLNVCENEQQNKNWQRWRASGFVVIILLSPGIRGFLTISIFVFLYFFALIFFLPLATLLTHLRLCFITLHRSERRQRAYFSAPFITSFGDIVSHGKKFIWSHWDGENLAQREKSMSECENEEKIWHARVTKESYLNVHEKIKKKKAEDFQFNARTNQSK